MSSLEFLKGNKLKVGTILNGVQYQIIIEYDGTQFVGWQYQKWSFNSRNFGKS